MIKVYGIFFFLSVYAEIYFLNPSSTRGKNVFDSRLDFSIFKTQNLFNTDGDKVPLNAGDNFKMENLDLNLYYGISNDLDLNLGMRARSNSSNSSGMFHENTNFESFWLSLKYLLLNNKKFSSSIEFLFRSTFYSNGNQMVESQQLILGDAGNQQSLFINGGYKISKESFFFGKIGMNWPENVLSTEAIYDGKFSFLFEPIRLDLGVGGTISFYKSPFPSLAVARESVDLNTGSSYLFVSWNRQSTIPYLELSYLGDEFNMGLNLKKIVAGKSTDNGTSLGFYISYHFAQPREPFKGFKYTYPDFKFLGKIAEFKKNYVKMSVGYSQDLEKGEEIYFFKEISGGKEVLVAKGIILEIGVNWSIIKISERLNNASIDQTLLVKSLNQK